MAAQLSGMVERLLRGFAPINRAARAAAIPTLLVSHGTVFGSVSEHGVPMAGLDHEFTTGALFDAAGQGVLLGHIHRHQSWEREGGDGRQCIAYAGSIGRFHHGEAGDKGFLLWTIGAGSAVCALQPLPARRTVDIEFAGAPNADSLREALATQPVDGAWVRLRWTVPAEDGHRVDRDALRSLLHGAMDVQFEGRIVPVLRTRASAVAEASTLSDKVRAWADLVEARAEPLLACLESLQAGDDDADLVMRRLNVADPPHDAKEAPLQGVGDSTDCVRAAQEAEA